MVFSSFTFIFIFLPIFLGLYFCSPKQLKNITALILSYLFYAWGAPTIILLLIISSAFDFYISRLFFGRNKKIYLALALLVNLGSLAYFKYANFFLDQVNIIFSFCEIKTFEWARIGLPAGISFFTFQKISYLLDVYYQRTKAADKLIDYQLYVAFFPQLIAGPILRYQDIYQQLSQRLHSSSLFVSGFCRFSIGLGKKVLIADAVARSADQAFSLVGAGTEINAVYAWIGIIAYALQIYFDFSGYSDMAIGLARMIGFNFMENFNRPYIAQTISEFWQRWHISLSNWMKEYLYIPLGGNRAGAARTYINLLIVFLLSGFWHGANWTFIVWGLLHGSFLILDRLGWQKISSKLPTLINISITFLIVLIGWVFFRAESLLAATNYLVVMLNPYNFFIVSDIYPAVVINNREAFFILLGLIIVFLPSSKYFMNFICKLWDSVPAYLRVNIYNIYALAIFILSVITISGSRFSPFLYFEF